jgi:acyl dehydratase
MRVITRLADLQNLIGEELSVSNWFAVDQERINRFAEATGDHQWIHVDPVRAATGPFGAPIAHGYLTLSMMPTFSEDAFRFEDVRMSVNYGLNRVRFMSPVTVGSELRARFRLKSMDALPDRGWQIVMEATIERKGSDKPVCVAETITRRYAHAG